MDKIDEFKDQWRLLSNFEGPTVKYGADWYPTVEHAYQAAKTLDVNIRKKFWYGHPGAAKKLGNTIELRPDWNKIRFVVMTILVRQKFLDRTCLELLLKTGNALLIEGNWWHDNYWGACKCAKCADKPKENNLGNILMDIREDMKAWWLVFDQKRAIENVVGE